METASCQVCEKGKADGIRLFLCNDCRSVTYCSRECQTDAWKTHKVVCKELNAGDAKQDVCSSFNREQSDTQQHNESQNVTSSKRSAA